MSLWDHMLNWKLIKRRFGQKPKLKNASDNTDAPSVIRTFDAVGSVIITKEPVLEIKLMTERAMAEVNHEQQ